MRDWQIGVLSEVHVASFLLLAACLMGRAVAVSSSADLFIELIISSRCIAGFQGLLTGNPRAGSGVAGDDILSLFCLVNYRWGSIADRAPTQGRLLIN